MLIELDEEVAIRRVTEHLKTTYSDSRRPDQVEAAVATAYAHFDALPIRTYVPVLVERKARRLLSDHTGWAIEHRDRLGARRDASLGKP